MSVVVRRDHPSGSVGISVGSFPDRETVVLGMGPLKDMKFFEMNATEAFELAEELSEAAVDAEVNQRDQQEGQHG